MRRQIRLLLAGSYLWYFGEGLLGPLYAVFAQKIGGDILEITGAYAVYLITMGVISVLVGKFSDNHSKEKIMLAGYALNAVATFGYLFVNAPAMLFLVQGLLGVAAALATPTWDSLFSKYLDKKRAGEEWGLSDGGPHIVMGISLLFGGVVVSYFGFETLFIIMGTMQAIATVVQSFLILHNKN